ncbi:hypothetical protein ALC56_03106 [Trachymyrmex septentrionalis]|uniref:Uncharacterized protein n=1 Tax=Trachymyrmex septentrionalis TaxID=34720 RepID=A0A151JZN0_9HYME|nr:hypothetical protein ALC56_03106 [Trachymyrmex septentrionalis]
MLQNWAYNAFGTCEKTAAKMAAEYLGFPPCGTDGEPVIGKKHAIVAKHA